jgi:hypothetical protein
MFGQTSGAFAEALVVPYTCSIENSQPRLRPGPATTYAVIGRRAEQPLSVCGSGVAASCTLMMVHRFDIDCGGVKVAWAKAAAASDVALPPGVPSGFAPVSIFSGRFVLPSLARHDSYSTQVSREDLSPDGIVYLEEPAGSVEGLGWETVVRSDLAPDLSVGSPTVTLAGVAAVLLVLAAFSAAVTAGRGRRLAHGAAAAWTDLAWTVLTSATAWGARVLLRVAEGYNELTNRAALILQRQHPDEQEDRDGRLDETLMLLEIRLIEVELAVSALRPGLLLRDVLMSEVNLVRQRIGETCRRHQQRGSEKTSAACRAILRELDRIARIARSSSEQDAGEVTGSALEMPRSVHDAYQILGLNAAAPPAAAKKLVDALRITWHPDFAVDEDDRTLREERMKQINAAWDLIRPDRRAVA